MIRVPKNSGLCQCDLSKYKYFMCHVSKMWFFFILVAEHKKTPHQNT